MGNIAQRCGQEANIARGEDECYIFVPRPHPCAIFPVVHKHKRYFNWFTAMYMEQYFWYYIFMWAMENKTQFGAFILHGFIQ